MNYRLIIEDDQVYPAEEQLTIDSLDRASSEALLGFREILADHLRCGKILTLTAIHIVDELGQILSTVRLVDAVRGVISLQGSEDAV